MASDDPRARPTPRWHHAATWLEDFAIITWAVDPERMQRRLPSGFEPHIWDDQAWVSAVAFNDVDFHFRFAPFVKMGCGQVNYRAYVKRLAAHPEIDDAESASPAKASGVWFFRTALDSRLVTIAERLWKMPWVRTPLDISGDWDANGGDGSTVSWSLNSSTPQGETRIKLTGTGNRLAPPPGIAESPSDAPDAAAVLFDPFDGWYERNDGSGVGRYTVWHEPLDLVEARVEQASCATFVELGLIDPDQPPTSAGLQRRVHFDVHTPPQRLGSRS